MKACDRGPRSTLLSERQSGQTKPAEEPCDMCGSDAVEWRKCKLVCTTCGTILKSCADL